jgi:membrane-associated protease RseP (regulator of RpoE activity)
VIYILDYLAASFFTTIIHESGHLFTAKIFKVGIHSFNIGFNNEVFGLDFKGVRFRFNKSIIGGGFIEFKEEEECNENETYLENLTYFEKIFITLSGALFNFFAALTIIAILSLIHKTNLFTLILPVVLNSFHTFSQTFSFLESFKINTIIENGAEVLTISSSNQYLNYLTGFLLFNTLFHIVQCIMNIIPFSIVDGGECILYTAELFFDIEEGNQWIKIYEIISYTAYYGIILLILGKDILKISGFL